jgi:hypothetical protein
MLGDIDSNDGAIREIFRLDEIGANLESIALLGTRNTLMLFGWTTACAPGKSKLRPRTNPQTPLSNCAVRAFSGNSAGADAGGLRRLYV